MGNNDVMHINIFLPDPKTPEDGPADGRALGILVESVQLRHVLNDG